MQRQKLTRSRKLPSTSCWYAVVCGKSIQVVCYTISFQMYRVDANQTYNALCRSKNYHDAAPNFADDLNSQGLPSLVAACLNGGCLRGV